MSDQPKRDETTKASQKPREHTTDWTAELADLRAQVLEREAEIDEAKWQIELLTARIRELEDLK